MSPPARPNLLPLLLLQIGVTFLMIVLAIEAMALLVTFAGLWVGMDPLLFVAALAACALTCALVAWLLRLERGMRGWAPESEEDWAAPFE